MIGINLSDIAQQRCPSWTAYEPGELCRVGPVSLGDHYSCAVTHAGTV